MIRLENISYQYKNGEKVLENINLEIEEGQMISIIGKNGTGKSTLLNVMAGIISPTSGTVWIDNITTKSTKDFIALRKKVGIVFQNPDSQILFPNVLEDIQFALNNLGLDKKEERIEEALSMVNMQNFKEKDAYNLSLGQKQRVNIASALAIKPKYLLLDEPTTMLDSMEKENIYKYLTNLKKQGYTIIFITNYADEILLSDKIMILEDKKIKSIFSKKEIMEHIDDLKQCDIKIPDMLQVFLKLKENGVDINLEEWTIEEMIEKIVKVCKK